MTDPEDVLAESLETLYDHVPVALSSAGSTFTYRPPDGGSAITLMTPDTQAANWSLHATSIWASSLFLADHIRDLELDRHLARAQEKGQRLRVLELGAGAGLPSVAVAKRYPGALVTASDYPDDALIRTLAENLERNSVSSHSRAVPYGWGSDPSILFSHEREAGADPGYDVVLAADTIWNSETHRIFIETLRLTLAHSPDARIYLVAGLHTGRYVIQSFLRQISAAGFVAEELTEKRVGTSEERPWSVEHAVGEDEAERRRWIIWMVFKWHDT
ncbi:hypothetical protein BD413DRAFT_473096 [Trametes elegans]|nr:hypothetical protein BD413DRAFT_473096 [Trametes elegans]